MTANDLDVPARPLRLVCAKRSHVEDDRVIALLRAWRERHMAMFPTQFPVTDEGTRTWLREQVVEAPDRVMWLIHAEDGGEPAGHLVAGHIRARERSASLGNTIAGRRGALGPGGMTACVKTVVAWAHDQLGAQTVWATPFADNERSRAMLRRADFVEEGRIGLRRHALGGGRVEFRPVEPGDARPPDRTWVRAVHRRSAP